MSITLMHTLLAAPLPHIARTGQCPFPTKAQCLLLPVRYFHTRPVNIGREQTTEPNNAPPLPTSKRLNKNTAEEKQCKSENWTEPEGILG